MFLKCFIENGLKLEISAERQFVHIANRSSFAVLLDKGSELVHSQIGWTTCDLGVEEHQVPGVSGQVVNKTLQVPHAVSAFSTMNDMTIKNLNPNKPGL